MLLLHRHPSKMISLHIDTTSTYIFLTMARDTEEDKYMLEASLTTSISVSVIILNKYIPSRDYVLAPVRVT